MFNQNRKKFSLTNEGDINALKFALDKVANDYPIVIDFLEEYCGYNTPVLSHNPDEICYACGKRDVILTTKTIMRDDISPKQITNNFK